MLKEVRARFLGQSVGGPQFGLESVLGFVGVRLLRVGGLDSNRLNDQDEQQAGQRGRGAVQESGSGLATGLVF